MTTLFTLPTWPTLPTMFCSILDDPSSASKTKQLRSQKCKNGRGNPTRRVRLEGQEKAMRENQDRKIRLITMKLFQILPNSALPSTQPLQLSSHANHPVQPQLQRNTNVSKQPVLAADWPNPPATPRACNFPSGTIYCQSSWSRTNRKPLSPSPSILLLLLPKHHLFSQPVSPPFSCSCQSWLFSYSRMIRT